MSDVDHNAWESISQKMAAFRSALARCRSVNVNTTSLKSQAKDLVQFYFRQARPTLLPVGFSEESLVAIDGELQEVLRLSNGNSRKSYYAEHLKRIEAERAAIDSQREVLLSRKAVAAATVVPVARSTVEQSILTTLQQVIPTAALSYEQGCRDLADGNRISFRGVASEFRECLREVLDHLAPDREVMAHQGFKLEDGQKKPTMKQKARFILRARGQATTAAKVPEDAVSIVEEKISGLARSVYERSSISSHVTTSKGEVTQVKMYVDTVLAELLEIHRKSQTN
jgi:Predicted pPIWI-associating nuclease